MVYIIVLQSIRKGKQFMKNANTEIHSRQIDTLGRIVLPKVLRDKAHISTHEKANVYYEDGRIIIEKEEKYCHICGNAKDVKESIGICQNCIEHIKNDEF